MSGIDVQYDPNRGWRQWHIDQIYTDENGTGNVVPNVNDWVVSELEGFKKVVSIDLTTGTSTLAPITFSNDNNNAPGLDDILDSKGPGTYPESFRVYIDSSVTPHRLAVDKRVKVPGSDVAHMKVFLGTDVENGKVISRMYNQTGVATSENIPMESIQGTNNTVKRPIVGYASEMVNTNEVVTAVFYDAGGTAVEIARFIVVDTTWVREVNAETKIITSVQLVSPFLSDSDPDKLNVPINLPIENIDVKGQINYNDGSRRILPIDGGKLDIFGLSSYIPTIVNQVQPFSLIYYLDETEVSDNTMPGSIPFVKSSYSAVSTKVENAYAVKIFTYPVWVDAVTGYRLKHYLYNLARNIVYDVTSKVHVATGSANFDPLLTGTTQRITFGLNLGEVDPSFREYTHLQTTFITLMRYGTDALTKWVVKYDAVSSSYGENLNAEVTSAGNGNHNIKVKNGIATLEEWLDETYYKVLPLYDSTSESRAPEPNMFRVKYGTLDVVYPISQWDTDFLVNFLPEAGELLTIEFFLRTNTEDLELAVVGMPITIV